MTLMLNLNLQKTADKFAALKLYAKPVDTVIREPALMLRWDVWRVLQAV
jgi:hypothetical protein